ncbi:MAG TPA: aldo/keto reductase [Pseudolysinimonas sp.]
MTGPDIPPLDIFPRDVFPREIFPLALGTNTFGWTADEATSFEVLDAFAASGGQLIDTADNYSIWAEGNDGGESETIIGRWLASRRTRDSVLVSTKVSRHPEFKGLGHDAITRGVEASLRRLQTDYIDIYYAHYDDPETPVEQSATTFRELQLAGKIRHVGLSNYGRTRLEEWIRVARANDWPLPVALQPHYNLLRRQPYERELAPVVAGAGIGVVPYFGLASGFLSGKFRTAADIERSDRKQFTAQYFSPEAIAVVETLDDIARAHGVQIPTVAIAWLRSRPQVLAPLTGARSVEQLDALIAAATFDLDPESAARLDAVSAKVPEAE